MRVLTLLTPPSPYRAMTCLERELSLNHIQTFLITQGHGGLPQLSDQLNAGATSKTTQTLKTIHIIHAPIHSNKVNMKGWLWRLHGGPFRIRDQLNAGATSEATWTWKTIHIIHAPIHSNKVNMKGSWWSNDMLGPSGPEAYRWGNTPKRPHPGNLSRPGIEHL